jgi:hypothetical protein
MAEAQGGVAGHRALARDDLANAVLRRLELPSEVVGADPDFAQFVAENFAGVDRWSGHVHLLQW